MIFMGELLVSGRGILVAVLCHGYISYNIRNRKKISMCYLDKGFVRFLVICFFLNFAKVKKLVFSQKNNNVFYFLNFWERVDAS